MQIWVTMAKTPKKSREEILEKKRIAERARYQRIKNDRQKYTEQKEKERLKYLKKKEEGKVKAAKDMTPRENREARKRWRRNVKAFRARQSNLKKETLRFMRENSPTSDVERNSNASDNQIMIVDQRKIVARKNSEAQRKKRNKEIRKKMRK